MKSLNLMLRASCLAVGALSSAVCLAEEEVYVGQDMGTIAVNGTSNSTIVAVAFKELGVEGTDVSAANIVSTRNLAAGDQLFIYQKTANQNDDRYVAWKLVEKDPGSSSSYLAWEKVEMISVGSEGQESQNPGPGATEVTVPVGSGFWLIRQPKEGRDMTRPFYIFGACATPSATNAAHGATSLMGNPCMTNAAPTVANAAEGDSIQLKTERGVLNVFTYKTVPKDQTLKWCGTVNTNGTPSVYAEVTPPTIPAGAGFWYVSKGAEDVTFTWPNN